MQNKLSTKPLRAAIIGLGQVGSRFDEDPGRVGVWSHAGAYMSLAHQFDICAAVEPHKINADIFALRCPQVPIYDTVENMLREQQPDVISICTPADNHAEIIKKSLKCISLKLIWCEKPLTTKINEAISSLDECLNHGVALVVTFNRRVAPIWQRARAIIHGGTLGTIRSLRIAMPNRVFSVGSHAIDLALFLGGPIDHVKTMVLPALEEANEPAVSTLLGYRSGAGGIIQVTGMKSQLIVEAETIGDDGRLYVDENSNTLVVERFVASPRYQGYRELKEELRETITLPEEFSSFIMIARNIANHLNQSTELICDGNSALEVQRILAKIIES